MARVALVQCPFWEVVHPKPAMGYLSAYLKKHGHEPLPFDFEIEFFNETPDDLKKYFHPDMGVAEVAPRMGLFERLDEWAKRVVSAAPDLVGMSIYYSTEQVSLELAKRIKALAPNLPIIFGGPSCDRRVHGPRLLESGAVDIVASGEGEATLLDVVERLDVGEPIAGAPGTLAREDGRAIDGGERELISDLDELPLPYYEPFDLKQYAIPDTLAILGSRGCPNRCKFCSERAFWKRYRRRSGESIYGELKHFHETKGVERFIFVDSLINGDMRELEKWLDLVIEDGMRIRWYGNAMLRKEMSYRMLLKMARAGCVLLQLGIESASPRVRGSMSKSADIGMVQQEVKDAARAGIGIMGYFIVAYPSEKTVDFAKTLWFISRNRKRINHIVRPTYPYVVLPSSTLFDEREKWGITIPEGEYHLWTDGKSTFKKRMRRLKFFRWWVNRLGIPSDIGPDVFDVGRPVEPRQTKLPPKDRVFEIVSVSGAEDTRAGGEAAFDVELRYTGSKTLWDYACAKRWPVGLGYHILNPDGSYATFDDGTRVYLDRPIGPGDTERFTIEVSAPAETGEYLVEFALVQDRVGWFTESSGHRARLVVKS